MNLSPPETKTTWHAPTAEALAEHLRDHAAQLPSVWVRRAPLFVIGFLIAIALIAGGPGGWLLPWLGFLGLIVYGGRRLRKVRSLEARLNRAQELATLRHHRAALRAGWNLIRDTQAHPPLQHRAVVAVVQCLDEVGAHDAAIVGYDRLLDDLPPEHPGAAYLQTHRAIAALFTDRLSDADETLRRLRGPVEELPGSPTRAAYRFAKLFQAVRTAHYAEGIAESDGLVEALRPLGIDAGYGHALRSWCHRRRDDAQLDDAAEAQRWWQRAVTLVPAAALRQRFPELRELGDG
jgi:tetratricopeptide (TPR) repeat protein